jgi:hypothetical protein
MNCTPDCISYEKNIFATSISAAKIQKNCDMGKKK